MRALLLATAIALASPAGLVQAAVITQAEFAEGASTQTIGPFTATAGGPVDAVFSHKTVAGVTAVGITAPRDAVPGEIGNTETLTLAGSPSNVLLGFTVGFLFAVGNNGDAFN